MHDTVRISKTIPEEIRPDVGMGGDNYIDAQGQWTLRLACWNGEDEQELHLHEADTFDLAGETWQVTKVHEPDDKPRGPVAELTRTGDG